MKLIKHAVLGILINAFALWIASYYLSGLVILPVDRQYETLIVGGLILGFINLLIKPIVKLLSLPFILLSAGLFYLVINAGMLWLLSIVLMMSGLGLGLNVSGFLTYIFAGLIIGVINTILHWLLY